MIVLTLVLIAATYGHTARNVVRIHKGVEDVDGKYPYVVALVKGYRRCSGTLVAPNWVLTAAHCLMPYMDIQYGDMTIHINETNTKRRILHMVQPPAPYLKVPDLGFMYVEAVPMSQYGKISALDYKALDGYPVQYAGYGLTHINFTKDIKKEFELDQVRPLQFGEGVVSTCDKKEFSFAPFLCVAPKCSNKEQRTLSGDPGGPLFYDGKVVAVHIGGETHSSMRYYAPLSLYLSWIQKIIASPSTPSTISPGETPIPIVGRTAFTVNLRNRKVFLKYPTLHNVSSHLSGLKGRLKTYREKVLAALFREIQ